MAAILVVFNIHYVNSPNIFEQLENNFEREIWKGYDKYCVVCNAVKLYNATSNIVRPQRNVSVTTSHC